MMSNRINGKKPQLDSSCITQINPSNYRSIFGHPNFINHNHVRLSLRIDSVNYHDKARKNLTEEIVNKIVTKVSTKKQVVVYKSLIPTH